MIPLTQGALNDIARGVDIEKPIFQVLGTKRLTSTDNERYRLLLSDGVTSTSFTMLATQLNHMVKEDHLTENSIVEITRYAMSNANSAGKPRKIMVVLGIEVKVPGHKVPGKIGNPVPDKSGGANEQSGDNSSGASAANTVARSHAPPPPAGPGAKKRLNESINSGVDIVTTPIAALSPYQNRWVIKARVTHKGDVRHWSNSRGEGKLFSMTLVDESGEIRCTGFTDAVNKFFDMIEIGSVYYISRGQLKVANKIYNTTNNEYEMQLNADSEIIPCHDGIDDVPSINFDFVPLSELAERQKGDICDVLAIVKSAEPVQLLTAKATGRELRKRDLTLVDNSDASITLTLWGSQAENFDGSSCPVIAAKGVRVGEFQNGKNLSSLDSTVIQIEPDIPAAHSLRGWYSTGGKSQDVRSLSKGSGGFNAEWMSLQEAHEKAISSRDVGQVCLCKATISLIRHERALYKSCPAETCKKKVIDHSNGMFRCEKCDREYPNFKYRLLGSISLADWSGNQWVTAFGEEGEKLLGMSSQELGELSESNHDEYTDKFAAAAFSTYIFKLRLKMENYNDESRLKGTILAAQPIKYDVYNKYLLQDLKQMNNIHSTK